MRVGLQMNIGARLVIGALGESVLFPSKIGEPVILIPLEHTSSHLIIPGSYTVGVNRLVVFLGENVQECVTLHHTLFLFTVSLFGIILES